MFNRQKSSGYTLYTRMCECVFVRELERVSMRPMYDDVLLFDILIYYCRVQIVSLSLSLCHYLSLWHLIRLFLLIPIYSCSRLAIYYDLSFYYNDDDIIDIAVLHSVVDADVYTS